MPEMAFTRDAKAGVAELMAAVDDAAPGPESLGGASVASSRHSE